jgi:hypothetical protein
LISATLDEVKHRLTEYPDAGLLRCAWRELHCDSSVAARRPALEADLQKSMIDPGAFISP